MQIEISKRKAWFFGLLSLAIGMLLLMYGSYTFYLNEITRTKWFLFTTIGIMMSVYSYAQFMIVKSSCLGLILSDEGVIDNSTLPTNKLIKWSEVKLISCPDLNPPPHFEVYLKNDKIFFDDLNWFHWLYFKITKMWYKTPLVLVTDNLKCNSKELNAMLTEYSRLYVQ